jgi:hypothetical protein
MSVETLERALADIGLPGTVEVRGSLAILRVDDEALLANGDVRRRAVDAMVHHGFSHVALEIVDDGDRHAPLHRH